MPIVDLTIAALPWLSREREDDRIHAYRSYQRDCAPWSIAVWEMSGLQWTRDVGLLDDFALAPQPELSQLITSRQPHRIAEDAIRRFETLTGLPADQVILVVGCRGSNAVQAWTEAGTGAVFCIEHLAPARLGLGLGDTQATGWIVHELAHCARYSLPGSRSPVASLPRRAEGFRDSLDSLSAAERLIDEGIASALQLRAASELSPAATLHFADADHRAILAAAPDLLATVGTHGAVGSTSAMLYQCETPASRWGYVIGAEIASRALLALNWPQLLGASAPDVLLAAAEASRDDWAVPLRALAHDAS